MRGIADGQIGGRTERAGRSRRRYAHGVARKAIEHAAHGGDLQALLRRIFALRIEEIIVTPPVPAALRIRGQGGQYRKACDRLRVEHDQAIGVGPLVVAGEPVKRAFDFFRALLAAVKCDMHATRLHRLAIRRHVSVPGVGHRNAQVVGKAAVVEREFALREFDDAGESRCLRRVQRAVDVLQ